MNKQEFVRGKYATNCFYTTVDILTQNVVVVEEVLQIRIYNCSADQENVVKGVIASKAPIWD